jgi:hypothetical protein
VSIFVSDFKVYRVRRPSYTPNVNNISTWAGDGTGRWMGLSDFEDIVATDRGTCVNFRF